jgi:hypothetical protein
MSLQTDGYLSPDITKWISKHCAEHAAGFALADRLSRVAQQVMLGAEVPKGDNRALLILLFFARTLSSFQGALLLAERGLTELQAEPAAEQRWRPRRRAQCAG